MTALDPLFANAIIHGAALMGSAALLSLGAVLTAKILRAPRYRYQLRIEDASMKADTMEDLNKLIDIVTKARGGGEA